jgi:hypothetical protein
MSDTAATTTTTDSDVPERYQPLQHGLKSMFNDPQYSDLTVKCEGRTWKVHKVVVCPQVRFFTKACDGRFKEAKDNTITLNEDHPDAVDAMLKYLYTHKYDQDAGENGTLLLLDIHVRVIADKYDIPTLVKLATTNFAKRKSNRVSPAQLPNEKVRAI